MTYRECRLAKAERLREWAGKREERDSTPTDAERTLQQIPFGQPILVGHHSENRHRNLIDRANRAEGRRIESLRTADRMSERADNIEAATENAIYSDDPDAIEELRARIQQLERERERIKRYNASCRKAAKTGGTGDLALLDEKQRAELATIARVCSYQLRDGAAAPAYWSSNLSGNIARNRKRLEALETDTDADRPRGTGRWIDARYEGECARCHEPTLKGERIAYFRKTREVLCLKCARIEAGERNAA